MTPQTRTQYNRPPALGMQRFWLGFKSWCENFPESSFPYWMSGESLGMRLKPSTALRASKMGLPETCSIMTQLDDNVLDEFYHSQAIFVAMIDAVDGEAAWMEVVKCFPDAEIQWEPELSMDVTLDSLAQMGRFT